MAIGTDAITIYAGEDVVLPFSHTDDTITGWALAFNVLKADGTRISKATGGSGVAITGANAYEVTLADTDTDGLADSGDVRLTYDCWRTDAGSETVLAAGVFIIKKGARDTA